MDAIAEEQIKINAEIERLIRNFRKDGPERKQSVDYQRKKQQELDTQWHKFQENNNTLMQMRNENPNHPYFTTEFYEKVQESCIKFTNVIKNITEVTKAPDEYDVHEEHDAYEEQDAHKEHETPVEENKMRADMFKIHEQLQNEQNEEQTRKKNKMPPLLKKQYQKVNGFFGLIHRINDKVEGKSRAYLRQMIKMLEDYWGAITATHDDIILGEGFDNCDYIKNGTYFEWESIYQDAIIATVSRRHRRC